MCRRVGHDHHHGTDDHDHRTLTIDAVSPYEVLGVAPDAPVEDIRRAYVRLARQHHPDYFVDASPAAKAEAEWRMRVLNEAWAVLGDDAQRRSLDAARPRGFQPLSPDDEDEEDPRLAPDVPYRPVAEASARDRLTVLAPALLFAASVVVGIVGSFMRLTGILAVSFVLFLLSCIGFLVVPLLALGRARQDEG